MGGERYPFGFFSAGKKRGLPKEASLYRRLA